MAFVYRYLSADGVVKYVGMVRGTEFDCLMARVYQHKFEERFRGQTWTVEYIDRLTAKEADFLEGMFIREARDTVFNKAKLKSGLIFRHPCPEFVWQSFEAGKAAYDLEGKKRRVSKAQQKRTNDWNAKAYDRINLTVPKGRLSELKVRAESLGKSVNLYIRDLIAADLGVDMERSTPSPWHTDV